jgi:hypothetical protein
MKSKSNFIAIWNNSVEHEEYILFDCDIEGVTVYYEGWIILNKNNEDYDFPVRRMCGEVNKSRLEMLIKINNA